METTTNGADSAPVTASTLRSSVFRPTCQSSPLLPKTDLEECDSSEDHRPAASWDSESTPRLPLHRKRTSRKTPKSTLRLAPAQLRSPMRRLPQRVHARSPSIPSSPALTPSRLSDSFDEGSRFRFSSFPASLPRVSRSGDAVPPGTIRKRPEDRSFEEDNTQNTSMTSIAEEADENIPKSPAATPRTRLNFNAAMSPFPSTPKGAYECRRMDSFASSDALGLTPNDQLASPPVKNEPGTPKEVQMHFQLHDSACSPIVDMDDPLPDPREKSRSSTGSSSARPMPDMSAFSDSLSVSGATEDTVSSPKLVCPPTPVRTPAWAGKINRSNSLIATKILATCSPGEPRRGRESLDSLQSVSMSDFEIVSLLGSGTFGDVYKVLSSDGRYYAVKKNRRQFRGKRDREHALNEVRHMQRLQSSNGLYLVFFYRAWQEDGYFFCQTELCCRDTCRELHESLRRSAGSMLYPSVDRLPRPCTGEAGRELPEMTAWKICHDVCAGLSHIHSHGIVHHDIKPSNMFLAAHPRFGAVCKIGDFGMAGDVSSLEDGQEGDQQYMAPEVLATSKRLPSSDVFSLGLSLYELASSLTFRVPAEGPRWHDIRSGQHTLEVPQSRSPALVDLIQKMLQPDLSKRLTCDQILELEPIVRVRNQLDTFLRDYIMDVEAYEDEQLEVRGVEEQTPRAVSSRVRIFSPPAAKLAGMAPPLHSK